jgi:hypothetical protein
VTQLVNFDTPLIRKTPDSRFSVYDAISFIAQKKNERMVWKRLVEQHMDIVTNVTQFTFPKGNGKATPVADKATIIDHSQH